MSKTIYFPGSSRVMTKDMLRRYRQECAAQPRTMTKVPRDKWPQGLQRKGKVVGCWRSKQHFAALWREDNGHTRLSINRTKIKPSTGDWEAGMDWDKLMKIKAECGFADFWCVEIYPASDGVVNVANLRHLWILKEKPPYAW